MHRQASLALGRCEGDGLRCLYHGWKFAADGTVLEVPNVANDDIVRSRLRAPTYPIRDAGGIVRVYLGPSELEPEFPEYAFLDVPATNRVVTRTVLDCNWLQSVESHIDSSHFGILHQDWNPFGNLADTNQRQLLRGDTDLSTSDNACRLSRSRTPSSASTRARSARPGATTSRSCTPGSTPLPCRGSRSFPQGRSRSRCL